MTSLECTLLPPALAIIILLLFKKNQWGGFLAIGSLAASCLWGEPNVFGQLILLASAVIILLAYAAQEFYILLLCSTLGALLCVESADFVHLFVGIELLTIPLYGLIAFDPTNPKNIQAATKYLILAGVSSALMLLGIAMLYADSKTLELVLNQPLGSCLFLAGVFFKLSLAPFHLWTPDVYEDAPLPVTAFLATVSKVAFMGILAQLSTSKTFLPILGAVAAVSMLVGAFLTLKSEKTTRFLAYSSIAHMGYVLAAWQVGSNIALYAAAYSVSLLLVFWILIWMSEQNFQATGLFYQKPWAAGVLIFGLLSLMGIPMTPVFWAKYQVLVAVLSAEKALLFGVFVFSSLLSAYGYARIVTKICQRTLNR